MSNNIDSSGKSSGVQSNALSALLNTPLRVADALSESLSRRTSNGGCEIPSPCWEPRPAGSCTLTLAPGSSGTIYVNVSNCGWTRQTVAITALGKLAGWVTFEPTSMYLGPQETSTFVVTVRVPDGMQAGARMSGPIILRGCVDHFIRLSVIVDKCAGITCCDVNVSDCADYVHHWYDHFYCSRPCRNDAGIRGSVNNG